MAPETIADLATARTVIADLQAANVNPDDVVAHIADQLAQRFGAAPARMPLEATVYTARKS